MVTGGAGFLGCNLVDHLAVEGRKVLVFDNLSRPGVERNLRWLFSRHPSSIAFARGDVRDADALRDAVKCAGAVIHLAAQVAVTTSIEDPLSDFDVNARGTLNVLEAVRAVAPEAPLIFASTNKVYGELFPRARLKRSETRYSPREPERQTGVDTSAPLSFCSPYGCSKGVADQYVLDYSRVFGLNTTVLRMSCLYGPRQFGTEDQGWVAHFLIAALAGRPITIFGDGLQVRDVLFVEDAVAAYTSALSTFSAVSGRAFNLGGGPNNTLSLLELLQQIAEMTGSALNVRFEPWRPSDQAWYVSNNSEFTAATGWRPQTSVRAGLSSLVQWVEGNVHDAEARVMEPLA